MGVKFIKIRFNTDKPEDKDVLGILNKVKGKNSYIKRAIIAYDDNKQKKLLFESIAAEVRSALSNMQFEPSSVSLKKEDITNNDSFEESADIADEFLDSL